jgi:hypothetical protein
MQMHDCWLQELERVVLPPMEDPQRQKEASIVQEDVDTSGVCDQN